MTQTPESPHTPDLPDEPATGSERGEDDRRTEVNPAENPAPSSPQPDEDVIRQSEEIFERIKPY